jgi:hypothetical protein
MFVLQPRGYQTKFRLEQVVKNCPALKKLGSSSFSLKLKIIHYSLR